MRIWKQTTRALILGLALAAPAMATAKIEKVLVQRSQKDMNIRVSLFNPDGREQRGPITLTLYARSDASSPWQKVKTWRNIHEVPAHKHISRDFFEQNNPKLQAIAAAPAFEARAVLQAPGTHDQEMTGVYDSK